MTLPTIQHRLQNQAPAYHANWGPHAEFTVHIVNLTVKPADAGLVSASYISARNAIAGFPNRLPPLKTGLEGTHKSHHIGEVSSLYPFPLKAGQIGHIWGPSQGTFLGFA